MTLFEVAQEISRRLTGTFLRGADGRRPVYGGTAKFQEDPHWRDLILFYEFFQGDNGAGLGASHQTGWTGLAAVFLDLFGRLEARDLELERGQLEARLVREQVGGQKTGQAVTREAVEAHEVLSANGSGRLWRSHATDLESLLNFALSHRCQRPVRFLGCRCSSKSAVGSSRGSSPATL